MTICRKRNRQWLHRHSVLWDLDSEKCWSLDISCYYIDSEKDWSIDISCHQLYWPLLATNHQLFLNVKDQSNCWHFSIHSVSQHLQCRSSIISSFLVSCWYSAKSVQSQWLGQFFSMIFPVVHKCLLTLYRKCPLRRWSTRRWYSCSTIQNTTKQILYSVSGQVFSNTGRYSAWNWLHLFCIRWT